MLPHEALSQIAPHIGWKTISETQTEEQWLVVVQAGIETAAGFGLRTELSACICTKCIRQSIAVASEKLFQMDRDFREKNPAISAMNFSNLRHELCKQIPS
jgi:hypothetical protein